VLQDAVRGLQEKSGIQPTGALNGRTRSALNGVEAPTPTFGSDEQRLVVNMERWRWMPEDMGDFHVWDNIPEYQTRVVRRGQVVHQAKIIVGRPETATVVFSANMRYVISGPSGACRIPSRSRRSCPTCAPPTSRASSASAAASPTPAS
jgi:murein L,D-transpeptidase YcbB/YkuD